MQTDDEMVRKHLAAAPENELARALHRTLHEVARLQAENAKQTETIALLHDKIAELTRWLAATEAEWKAAMEKCDAVSG